MTRQRFQDILQNLHCNDNDAIEIRMVVDILNEPFSNVVSKEGEESIDEYMTKFNGKHSMKQILNKVSEKMYF